MSTAFDTVDHETPCIGLRCCSVSVDKRSVRSWWTGHKTVVLLAVPLLCKVFYVVYAAGFRFRFLAVYPVLCRCYRNCSKTRRAEQILIRPLAALCQRSLTMDARPTVATAFIASRVHYCSAVLYGVTSISHYQCSAMSYTGCRCLSKCSLKLHSSQLYPGWCRFCRFPAHPHADGESVCPSRSPFCGTWRSDHAENIKGTPQTKASFFNTYQNLTGRGC